MNDLEISQKIISQYLLDQNYRSNPESSVEEMVKIDEETYQLMNRIVSQVGAISISRFGQDVSTKAWLLVQHCDNHVDFQQIYLDLMLKNPDDFSKKDIAYLTDRVAVNTNKPQVYATQFKWQKNGKYIPNETIDPQNVNQRRLEVGLSTLEDYAKTNPNWDVSDFYQN